ncbi:cation-translocating P-type ATPase [Chlamydiia bacterium]|nr:cation-translocating P-type ATPase [Chlamydiia bacterium]
MNITDTNLLSRYFQFGQKNEHSPFLKSSQRQVANNLDLKKALFSALLFVFHLIIIFTHNSHGEISPFLQTISHLLLVIVFLTSGTPAVIGSIKDLLDYEINIDLLMTLAAFASIPIGHVTEGALLLVLFDVSKSLETFSTDRAEKYLHNIQHTIPEKAWIKNKRGIWIQKHISEISLHALIMVKPGELIPLDGIVESGTTTVSTSHLTGEDTPLTKKKEDRVISGSKVLTETVIVKVTQLANSSTVKKISQLIDEAQTNKPPLENKINSFLSAYSSTIICLSILLLCYYLYNGDALWSFNGALTKTLSFLVITSPCSIILAVPIAYISVLSSSLSNGVVIRNGHILDSLTRLKHLIFDKTGTLTTGVFSIESVHFSDTSKKKMIMENIYAISTLSSHPISEAISLWCQKKKTRTNGLHRQKHIVGMGLEGVNKNKTTFILGNIKLLSKTYPTFVDETNKFLKKNNMTNNPYVIYCDGQSFACIILSETIRDEAVTSLSKLREQYQIQTHLLSGDHVTSVTKVANTLGIEKYWHDQLPEEKIKIVKEISQSGTTGMVGDGINDAPALAQVDVSIAMGKNGSAASSLVSQIILLNDKIDQLPILISKALKARRIITQNITISLFVIIFFGLYSLSGELPLWLAVVLHEGGTICVAFNSLRLLRKPYQLTDQ